MEFFMYRSRIFIKRDQAGFSLVEVMIALALISILVALGAQFSGTQKKMNAMVNAKDRSDKIVRFLLKRMSRDLEIRDQSSFGGKGYSLSKNGFELTIGHRDIATGTNFNVTYKTKCKKIPSAGMRKDFSDPRQQKDGACFRALGCKVGSYPGLELTYSNGKKSRFFPLEQNLRKSLNNDPIGVCMKIEEKSSASKLVVTVNAAYLAIEGKGRETISFRVKAN